MMLKRTFLAFALLLPFTTSANTCDELPCHGALTNALKKSVKASGGSSNGGLDLHMWATIVNRSGEVCAVTRTGDSAGAQWPGSRVISAQKANTANAFSLSGLALSTANLWAPTQPGGSLFGLQHSNPVDTSVAYRGEAQQYGSKSDPMQFARIGGVNVFGGGLALYNKEGEIVGAIGVSGDTSCADHNVAWKVRDALRLDYVSVGVSESGDDNIIYAEDNDFHHPSCGGKEAVIAKRLPISHPISK